MTALLCPKRASARSRSDKRDATDGLTVPIALPRIVLDLSADGRMDVTVDGNVYAPETPVGWWRREDFGRVIEQVVDAHDTPVRVEVRESDGSVFTDIVTPRRRHRADARREPQPPSPDLTETFEIHNDGFITGEDVAVVVVIAHLCAGPDGRTDGAAIEAKAVCGAGGRLDIVGRASGRIVNCEAH